MTERFLQSIFVVYKALVTQQLGWTPLIQIPSSVTYSALQFCKELFIYYISPCPQWALQPNFPISDIYVRVNFIEYEIMFLTCKRKPEYLEETYTNTRRTFNSLPILLLVGFKPRNSLLQGNQATMQPLLSRLEIILWYRKSISHRNTKEANFQWFTHKQYI